MTSRRRTPWLVAFLVAATVHLVLNGLDVEPWDSITKCLLAPLLIGWVVAARGPRRLMWALFFCFLGDLFLEIDGWFLVGMAAFAVGHVCFVTLFLRLGALGRLRARPWIVGGYVLAAIPLLAWAWGGLPVELKAAIPVYAALLIATASTSAVIDRVAGVGGLLFLVSDAIIALGEAGRVDLDATLTGLAIMSLYCAAIALLTAGVLRRTTSRPGRSAKQPTAP